MEKESHAESNPVTPYDTPQLNSGAVPVSQHESSIKDNSEIIATNEDLGITSVYKEGSSTAAEERVSPHQQSQPNTESSSVGTALDCAVDERDHALSSEVYEPKYTHILSESQSMTDLQFPIRNSGRIQFSAIGVCDHYLASGTNTGCLYIFQRNSLKYLQMIQSEFREGGAITILVFSPKSHNILGYGTSKGYVAVIELRADRRGGAQKLRTTSDHQGASITSLCWNPEGDRLYIGDDQGKVTFTNVTASKTMGLFKFSSEMVMQIDSPVVQIDTCDDKLLVSAYDRTYLGNTTKQQVLTIGKKLRDGRYGACFYPMTGIKEPVIYCARPGSRMWEVSHGGAVLNTVPFRDSLAIPPLPIVNLINATDEYTLHEKKALPQSLAFPKLIHFCNKYLITWSKGGIYVFNPAELKVVLWSDEIKDIISLTSQKNDLYAMLEGGTVRKLSLHTIPKLISHVYSLGYWTLACDLINGFQSDLLNHKHTKYISLELISDLHDRFRSEEQVTRAELLSNYLSRLNKKIESYVKARERNCVHTNPENSGFYRDDNGMYVRTHRSFSCESDDLPDPGDLSIVLADSNVKPEDTRSIDNVSIGSTDSGGSRSSTIVPEQVKNTLLKIREKVKIPFVSSSQNLPAIEKSASSQEVSATPTVREHQPKENTLNVSNAPPKNEDVREPYDTQTDKETAEVSTIDVVMEGTKLVDSCSEKSFSTRECAVDPGMSSDTISLSSSELVFGPPETGTPDPEPVYAKNLGVPRRKGKKKKRAKTVDLDGDEDTTAMIRKTGKVKKSKDQPVTVTKKLPRSISTPDAVVSGSSNQQSPETEPMNDAAESIKKQVEDLITGQGSPCDHHNESPVPSPTVSVTKSADTADDVFPSSSSNSGSPSSPKSALLKISSKMQTTAKSVMQTIKETGNKITGKSSDVSSHIQKDTDLKEETSSPVHKLDPTQDHHNCHSEEEASDSDEIDETFPYQEFDELAVASKLAQVELSYAETLYNPSACRKVLLDWVRHLHIATRAIHQMNIVMEINQVLQEKLKLIGECKTARRKENESCNKDELNGVEAGDDPGNIELNAKGFDSNVLQHESNIISGTKSHIFTLVTRQDVDIINDHIRNGTVVSPDVLIQKNVVRPYNMPGKYQSLPEMLRELVTMCFEFCVHGNIVEYMCPFPDITSEEENVNMDCSPANYGRNEKDDLEQVCIFMDSYFYYMDAERIHQAIIWSPQAQRPQLFHNFVEISKVISAKEGHINNLFDGNQIDAVFDKLRSCVLIDKISYISIIQRLLQQEPNSALQFCSEHAAQKFVNPIEVLYLCKELGIVEHFIYYCRVYCEARQPSIDDPLVQLCADTEVCFTLLECLLKDGAESNDIMCQCKFAKPLAHRIPRRHAEEINRVLKLPQCQNRSAVVVEKLLLNYGYWLGFLNIRSKYHRRQSGVLKLVMQLNDQNLLQCEDKEGFLLKTEEDWEEALRLKSQQSPEPDTTVTCCLNCGSKIEHVLLPDDFKQATETFITWEFLATRLVQSIGATKSMNLLQKANISKGALPFSFYRWMLKSKSVENKKRTLNHNMMERFDTYLWSRRSTILPPKVLVAANAERSGIQKKEDTGVTLDKMLTSLYAEGASLVMEEPESHWGIKTTLTSRCPRCGMHLSHMRATIQLGLIYFQCGHGFHKVCNNTGQCLICL